MYATAPERMVDAIGEPTLVDTSSDERLGRIFSNRTIKIYPTFADFYGMEDTIERIVGYFRYASQGLEERKQILYLLGPVGGGKSSLAERAQEADGEAPDLHAEGRQPDQPGLRVAAWPVPSRAHGRSARGQIRHRATAAERTDLALGGQAARRALRRHFEIQRGEADAVAAAPDRIAKTEPGDENNQDVSALVGKVDIRQLENFSQSDPDAYSYSGGLNRTTQGLLEFVEMFKAPIKVLHPLLTATQEGSYNGTENFGAFPYQGIVVAHSNESEWLQFKTNKNNEAFLDRILVVKVPYCLRVTEEKQIYEKLLRESELAGSPCAPEVLDILSRFTVSTRLAEHENSPLYTKMRVYDGENLKETDPKAKSVQEYRDAAGVDEGMTGVSTRFAFKILSQTFNYDTKEVAADPVHLMYILEQAIKREQFPKETEAAYLDFIKSELATRYAEFIGHEIQKAYLESYSEYGQNLFDRYIAYADAWIEDQDYKDPDTGQILNREVLDSELSQIEKPAGIANPKDFRNEVVKFTLRARARNHGRNPSWTSYEKLREVIEKRMFGQVEDLLPVISFGSKKDSVTEKQHTEFVQRMVERGYTKRQVRRLVDWYMRVNKAG